VSTIAHLPAAACTTSAPGSKSPLGRGGGATHHALGVLPVFPVVSVRLCAPHAPPGADRDKPGLWAHVLSKERTLGYIATAGDGLRTHLRDLARDLDSQTLASHAYQSSCL